MKRHLQCYLCAIDPEHHAGLSETSKRSLEVQGGPMNQEELLAFEVLAGTDAAVALRRRDDRTKVAGKSVPPLATYRDYVFKVLEGRVDPLKNIAG